MGYLVLARKYRPQTFDEVVGQQHVTQTLKNAIKAGRVAHAILFAGPRGTGKTTIARILAKAMNCKSGPTDTPCNQCASCLDITAGRGADVFEIDGASNNSVDQVRELRENSRYMPAHSRFRIYIIDEVHMLSIAAFNALLKTLEEPPAHVMFFFATTESHKIPITILSRCQRHDLRRVDLGDVVAHMETLCQQESMAVSSGNLWTIARESGGSMRDALSLLDQVMVSTGGQLADDSQVMALLGCVDRSALFDLSQAVFSRDMAKILSIMDMAFKSGQDMKRFHADLMVHFRHLMLVKMAIGADILTDVSPHEMKIMADQVRDVPLPLLDQILNLLFAAETSVRYAAQPRLVIEMVFFKIFQIVPALPIDQLITRIDALLKDPRCQVVVQPAEPAPQIRDEAAAYGDAKPDASAAAGKPEGLTETLAETLPTAPADEEKTAMPYPEHAPQSAAPPASTGDPWETILAAIRKTKPAIAGALSKAADVSVSDTEVIVMLSGSSYIRNLVKKHMDMIREICREQGGGRTIDIRMTDENLQENEKADARQKAEDLKRRLMNHPLVADAVDIFSGRIDIITPEEEKS